VWAARGSRTRSLPVRVSQPKHPGPFKTRRFGLLLPVDLQVIDSEAPSHTLSRFKADQTSESEAWLSVRVHRLALLIVAGSHFAGGLSKKGTP
jgi:hypothetical protein